MQVEIKEVVDIGYLNGLFVLARSIGLIGARIMLHTAGPVAELRAAEHTRQQHLRSFQELDRRQMLCRPCVGPEAAATATVQTSLG